MKVMDFLIWHYQKGLRAVLQIGYNFLVFIFHFFSTDVHLRTLFHPWKRLYREKETAGFNPGEIFERVSFNLVSIWIGFTARVLLIFLSLLAALIWVKVWVALFAIWLFFPPISLPWYFISKRDKAVLAQSYRFDNEKQLEAVAKEVLRSARFRFVAERLGVAKEVGQLTVESINIDALTKLYGQSVTPGDFVKTLWASDPTLQSLSKERKIEENYVVSVCNWYDRDLAITVKRREFWKLENLLSSPGVGQDLAYGYSPTLDRFSVVMTDPKRFYQHLIGRGKAVAEIERTLTKQVEGNVLLVGESGVGKRTVVFELAKKIYEGKSLPALRRMRVLELDIISLITNSDLAQAKATLKAILDEAGAAGNIVLVINNIDNYLATGEGKSDLSEVIVQGLSDARVKIIGIATPDNYQKYILRNPLIAQHFDTIEVVPPTKDEAVEILQDWAADFEDRSKVFILEQTIVEIVERADRLITEVPFPEKAINLLEETAIYAAETLHEKVVTPAHVDAVLSAKLKIPLGDLTAEETEKLKKFDELIHKRIVDQVQAVEQLAMSLRRTRLGTGKSKNLGTFLFLGPTGVGKTETAKVLAQSYFGSKESLDRLDMAEFQGEEAIERLIGSVKTQEPGVLTRMLREKPFGVLLIDEIEKATREINNLFLTVLDEGYINDAWGKKVSVANKIIIATSNAGSEFIREKVAQGTDYPHLRDELTEYVLREKIFAPEFINRFDAVVVYEPLSKEHLREVARILLGEMNERLTKERDVTVKITDSLLDRVSEEGYDPQFGARFLQRAIARIVEDYVAKKILAGEVKKGEVIEIS